MILSLTKTKKQQRSARFVRGLCSGLLAVVIGVNVFGAFASLAFAAIPTSIQTRLTQAATYAQAARDAATIAQNPSTARDAVSTAAVNAGNAQRQMIAEFTAARNELIDLRNRRTISTADFNEANTALTQAQVSTNPNSPAGIARAAVEAADAANRTRATASGDLDAQQRARALSERNTATTGSGASTGGSAGQDKKNATHPVDICFSRNTSASICIASIFYVFFVDLTSPIAYLSGAVFDAFANVSLESGTYASAVIAKGWVIARDIANMAFVFILIYIAFMLILNLEGVGIARQIAGVIAVALLINFSFFFTRVVIDMSNILAHEFYDQINAAPSQANPSLLVAGAQALVPTSISEKVMAGVNPQTLISADSFQKFLNGGTFVGNLAILITLFLIFGIVNVILAAVFLTAAFQFLSRIVALWFAIILSPIAFISFITPKMNGLWTKWLNLLISNAFYAPAFLFVIYIAVKMLDNGLISANIASFLGGSATAATGVDPMKVFLNSIVGVVLRLSIIVGLFIAALKVGSYVGVLGGKEAEGWGKKLSIGGNAAIIGGVGRRTFGLAGNALARNEFVRNRAAMVGGFDKDGNKKQGVKALMARTVGYGFGRSAEAIGVKAATSSFDARATSIPGASLGGKAQKGGYREMVKVATEHKKHIEHDRHDRPEEKAVREMKEKKVKEEIGYDSKKTVIETEHKTIEKEQEEIVEKAKQTQNEDQTRLTAAIQNLSKAVSEKKDVSFIRAAEKERDAAKEKLTASQTEVKVKEAEKNKVVGESKVAMTSRIKELDEQVMAVAGPGDEERKKAYMTQLKSRNVSNLWTIPTLGIVPSSSLRAAAEIAKGKSAKDNLLDAAKKLADEEKPKEETSHASSTPAPAAARPAGPAAPPPAAGHTDH